MPIQNSHHQNSLTDEYGHATQFRLMRCKHKFPWSFEDYTQEACVFLSLTIAASS